MSRSWLRKGMKRYVAFCLPTSFSPSGFLSPCYFCQKGYKLVTTVAHMQDMA